MKRASKIYTALVMIFLFAPIALLLYMAIATDTGCFVYSNTTPETHRIAAALMETLIALAQTQGMERVILTCKAEKIHYYSKFGFQNKGVSNSTHGGAVWYDMILEL